ncbi:phosphatidate cytidylyltransferase [uncultured Sphingomonas sp.]|uniref:phosphatidate cytidylyltransferase n=1 Tax=uncultured Sphingomonas sp. TaxID=158754 RepID=UPI002609CAD7|nr:phosphatidate cytidylyltransferase [uncultured Sphingomonas sp.]
MAAAVMAAVALLALWIGGFAYWLLMVVIALFMMAEWSDLTATPAREKRLAQYALSVPLAILAPIAAGASFLALGLIAAAFFFVAIVTRRGWLASGTIYCGLPVLALVLIREQDHGLLLSLWALVLVWMTDIGAFFAGRAIGGPKLAPRVSPNKTWAGLIGGIVAATAFAFVLHVGYDLPLRLLLATPVLGVVAQGGDLFESWLKRRAGVKDSGNVLPGHGGLLDRLDGLVPVAPLAALLVVAPMIV